MSLAGRTGAAVRRGPLGQRTFSLLTLGQATSTIGDFCYAVALPWLVLSQHGGPALLGAVLACYGVPRTVLIPVGGMLADKIGPRAIMLGADSVRCALAAGLAALAVTHTVSLLALGPVAALIGAGAGLFLPAAMSIMPALLPGDQLQAGNAINGAVMEVGALVGPAAGGVIVALAGSAAAFSADAGSFLISALTLALIGSRWAPIRAQAAAAPETAGTPASASPADAALADPPLADAGLAATSLADTALADTALADTALGDTALGDTALAASDLPADGGIWTMLRHSQVLRLFIVVCVTANLAFGGAFEVALPALAHARFGAEGYGAMLACLGAGAVLGTLAAARGGKIHRPAMASGYAFLIESLAIGLIPFLGGLPGAAAATFVFGACNGFANTVILTQIQKWAPPQLLGRVMSVIMLSSMGSFPLSVFVTGLLVRRFGAVPFFPFAAVFLAVSILFALTQRVYRDFGSPGPQPARPSGQAALGSVR
jgi:MFS family permease